MTGWVDGRGDGSDGRVMGGIDGRGGCRGCVFQRTHSVAPL